MLGSPLESRSAPFQVIPRRSGRSWSHRRGRRGRRFAATAPDEQVILLGSHPLGEARPHSDVDFLVGESEVANEAEESARLYWTLRDLRPPADVIVVSRDYADRWREVRRSRPRGPLAEVGFSSVSEFDSRFLNQIYLIS